MKNILNHTFLSIPVCTWILQLLYVAIALAILYLLRNTLHLKTDRVTWVLLLYIVIVIIINIIWRMAIKK